jgi:uncharacterized protein (DUF2252 family)
VEQVATNHRNELAASAAMVPRSIEDALAEGRALRRDVPRRAHASPAQAERDAVAILMEQNETRLADLVPIRIGRMLQSPFSYYRGTAAVMAYDLGQERRTGVDLVVCGDAHVSNFGLFAAPDRRVLFDLNDFDEAAVGPWEWDVKRLAASSVIGARDLGFTEAQCTEAAMATLAGYRRALRELFSLSALERFYYRVESDWLEEQAGREGQRVIRKAIKKARRRTSDQVLAKITTKEDHGALRIIDEFPIIRHDEAAPIDQVAGLFDAYRLTVRTEVTVLMQQFRVVDTVLRVVGVGSVGTRCYIALLLGPADEPLFMQIKEAPPSVLASYGGLDAATARGPAPTEAGREGWRVVAGQRILQAASDPFLGWIHYEGRDFYCRQFRDMKGSIELAALAPSQFNQYGALCGAVLARAHAQSPGAAVVLGYIGSSLGFDEAVTTWSRRYADQVERDYAALESAVKEGRLPAETGV